MTSWATVFTVLGSGWVMLLLLPLLLFRRHREATLSLTAVLLVTAAAVWLLKLVFHRVRPCNGLEGVRCLWGDTPTDYSFPSGHAAGSFAFAAFVGGVLLLSEGSKVAGREGAIASVLVLVAACIGLSRIYLGVHFPGDVVGGACLGSTLGILGAYVHVLRMGSPKEGGAPSSRTSPHWPETRS
jgi:undecaprenyl-diphosphatase